MAITKESSIRMVYQAALDQILFLADLRAKDPKMAEALFCQHAADTVHAYAAHLASLYHAATLQAEEKGFLGNIMGIIEASGKLERAAQCSVLLEYFNHKGDWEAMATCVKDKLAQ